MAILPMDNYLMWMCIQNSTLGCGYKILLACMGVGMLLHRLAVADSGWDQGGD